MTELNLDKDKFPLETYEPLKRIGRGGSGEVFLCRNRKLGNQVAVKTLRFLTQDLMLELQQEAKTSCKLNHQNLISVLDFGATTCGYPFLVMEYVSGVSLAKIIKQQGRLPIAKALEIMILVLTGLGYAHSKGILHRDISSNNVLVDNLDSETPMVKVIDFGAALSRIAGFETITSQGKTIIGTPAYMSPDSVRGQRYNQTSELYSVGCVLFEALTGRVPFEGESPLVILSAHSEKEPPTLGELVPEEEFPPELEAIVAKCLKKSPSERYQSTHRLKVELQSVLKELSAPSAENTSSLSTISGGATVIQKRFKRKKGVSISAVLIVIAGLMVLSSVSLIKGEPAANLAAALGTPVLDLLADLGNPFACVIAGQKYQEGRSVPKNSKRAFNLFRKAADADLTSGIYHLGNCYRRGIGVTAAPRDAHDFLIKAANRGFAPAERSVGEMQSEGEPIKDYVSIDWFKRAAEHGDAAAKSVLGVRIVRDQNIEDLREWSTGLRFLEEAANADYTPAEFSLGLCHEIGLHTPIDSEKATYWYKRAVKKGDPDAQVRLGLLIENDKSSTQQDFKKAFQLYEKSARKGNLHGKLALSHCYRNGVGTTRDLGVADNILEEVENEQSGKKFHFLDKKSSPKIEAPAFMISTDSADQSTWDCRDYVNDNDLILLQNVNNLCRLDLLHTGFIKGPGLDHVSPISLVNLALSYVETGTLLKIGKLSNVTTLFLKLNDDGEASQGTLFTPVDLDPVGKLGKLRAFRVQCTILTPKMVAFLSSLDRLETPVLDIGIGIENDADTGALSKLKNLSISVPGLEGNMPEKLQQVQPQNFGLTLAHCSLESMQNLANIKIARLELKETAVSDQYLPLIAKIPTLRAVNFIGSSQITEAGMAKLQKLRPDLTIKFERGQNREPMAKPPW